jgi:hypothetical protein
MLKNPFGSAAAGRQCLRNSPGACRHLARNSSNPIEPAGQTFRTVLKLAIKPQSRPLPPIHE